MATKETQEIKIEVSKEEFARAKTGSFVEVYIPGTEERTAEIEGFNRVEKPECVIVVQHGKSTVKITPKKISGRVKITGKKIGDELYRNYYVVELGDIVKT